jgi:sugar phosphate isomerase/epimerase
MRIGFMMPFNKERMDFANKWGFKSAELQVAPGNGYFPGDPGWETKAEEVKAAFQAADIRISCLAGFYVNHMDPEKAEENRKLYQGTVLLTEKLGVGVAAGFSGRLPSDKLEDSLPKYKEIWSENAKFAEDHGVKVAFEHCPMGHYNTPAKGINMMCTPDIWEKAFNEVPSPALGLEWDPSHLICMFIDPVENLRKFGSRTYHVHAKDAHVNADLLARYGIWYPGATEHCHVGLGDTQWNLCVKELLRQGYTNDLNVEGWHDAVFGNRQDGARLEDQGLIMALRHLEQFIVQD